MQPTILITRPDPAAHRFADMLRAVIGCDVPMLFSPLIRIEPGGTMPALDGVETLIFTSRNGVTAFTRASHRRDIPCYCVGDATAELACAQGLRATSCGGDADRLVARILADKVPGQCLHIRGEHGVGNIAARLRAGGIKTKEAVLYRQVAQALNVVAINLLHREAPVIIPLFSRRSARLISEGLSGNAPVIVAAISQAVADALSGGNLMAVIVAKSPDASGMIDAIGTAMAQANTLEGDTSAQ